MSVPAYEVLLGKERGIDLSGVWTSLHS